MLKYAFGMARVLPWLFLPALVFPQSSIQLSTADEIRAGDALFAAFQKSQGFADTPESKAIEAYLQKVGDKVAQNVRRKLPYKFHLDPHPGYRSAVGYPGGQIVVGGGILALMQHEDELAVVLGHEIETRCRKIILLPSNSTSCRSTTSEIHTGRLANSRPIVRA